MAHAHKTYPDAIGARVDEAQRRVALVHHHRRVEPVGAVRAEARHKGAHGVEARRQRQRGLRGRRGHGVRLVQHMHVRLVQRRDGGPFITQHSALQHQLPGRGAPPRLGRLVERLPERHCRLGRHIAGPRAAQPDEDGGGPRGKRRDHPCKRRHVLWQALPRLDREADAHALPGQRR